jgi:hypothetical protein
MAPNYDSATQTNTAVGTAGLKGIGGKPSTNDGVPGAAQAVLSL